jgi:hypothetical protein
MDRKWKEGENLERLYALNAEDAGMLLAPSLFLHPSRGFSSSTRLYVNAFLEGASAIKFLAKNKDKYLTKKRKWGRAA